MTTDDAVAIKEAPQPPEKDQRGDSFIGHFLRNLWSANTVTVTVLSVVLALVIGAVLIVISDSAVLATFSYFTARPSDALTGSWGLISTAYADLFKGSIADPEAVSAWLDGSGC